MIWQGEKAIMQENRNTSLGTSCDGRGTVCIDTKRVLDCCRDRDCFENSRIYLTAVGEETLSNSSNVRTRSAKLLWAFVGVDGVPFNNGFYQITVRYYVQVELEACLGMGRSQTFNGLAVLEKNVVLYGGEGSIVSYSSSPENNYCCVGNTNTVGNNDPVAIVETVEPIILGSKVECSCACACNDCSEIPPIVCDLFDGELVTSSTGPKLYVSFGIFSVIRIVRPAQFLVQATDYSVPDKECPSANNDDNPCALFRNISFPINQFRGTNCPDVELPSKNCGCGCSRQNGRNDTN